MVDIATLIYEVLKEINGIKWSPIIPDVFNNIDTTAIGSYTINSSVATSTTTRRERSTNVRLVLNVWSKNAEERNRLLIAVDDVIGKYLKRLDTTQLEEQLDKRRLYRSIAIYNGVLETESLNIYK